MCVDGLLFHLELYDGYGLVHLAYEFSLAFAQFAVSVAWQEDCTRVVLVGLQCKCCEGQEVDAIAILQCVHVAKAKAEPQYGADAALVACRSSHPKGIVVAPGEVEVMVVHQCIHDDVCTGAAVPYVAQNVHLVNGQTLYHLADGCYEIACLACLYNTVYDTLEVGLLVAVLGIFMHQFFDDVGKLLGQCLAHLATGVLAADALAHTNQPKQGVAIEFGRNLLFLCLQHFQFFLRIVYERAKFTNLLFAKFVFVEFAYLALDIARGIAQNVLECFVLSMYVCHEMLGTFG